MSKLFAKVLSQQQKSPLASEEGVKAPFVAVWFIWVCTLFLILVNCQLLTRFRPCDNYAFFMYIDLCLGKQAKWPIIQRHIRTIEVKISFCICLSWSMSLFTCFIKKFKILASLCSWAGCFVFYLVRQFFMVGLRSPDKNL